MSQTKPPTRQPTQQTPARAVIADDHDLARAGLKAILESDRAFTVVGEASDGMEAVALCEALKPDLALLDIQMPNLDGVAATRAIRLASPGTRIVIVTAHEHPDYVMSAIKAGAAGYLLKDVARRDLLATLGRVLRGEAMVGREQVSQPLRDNARQPAGAGPERLTPRERDVLRLVVEGQTNRQIAGRLSLSVGTVKIHVEHIIAKLGVADRTQAAVHAVERRLLQ